MRLTIVTCTVLACLGGSVARAQQAAGTEAMFERSKDGSAALLRDAERKFADADKALREHREKTDPQRPADSVVERGATAVRGLPRNIREGWPGRSPSSQAKAGDKGLRDLAGVLDGVNDLGKSIADRDKNNRRTAELATARNARKKELDFMKAVDKHVNQVVDDHKSGRPVQGIQKQCKDTLTKTAAIVSDREARRRAEQAQQDQAKRDRDRRGIERATEPGSGRKTDAPADRIAAASKIA